MAFDLQEQEQIDALKANWNKWGKWVAGIIICLAVIYLGYTAYSMVQTRQVRASANVYLDVQQAVQSQSLSDVKSATSRLEADYPASPYTARAALLAAKLGYDKNDLVFAKAQLNWALKNAREPALVALAQLRLANVLMDEKQYAQANAMLDQPHDAAFDAMYFDAKGDLFTLKGEKGAARDAYRAALAKLAGDSPSRDYIQIKFDALGA